MEFALFPRFGLYFPRNWLAFFNVWAIMLVEHLVDYLLGMSDSHYVEEKNCGFAISRMRIIIRRLSLAAFSSDKEASKS